MDAIAAAGERDHIFRALQTVTEQRDKALAKCAELEKEPLSLDDVNYWTQLILDLGADLNDRTVAEVISDLLRNDTNTLVRVSAQEERDEAREQRDAARAQMQSACVEVGTLRALVEQREKELKQSREIAEKYEDRFFHIKQRLDSAQECKAQELGSRTLCNCIVCDGFKSLCAERDQLAATLAQRDAELAASRAGYDAMNTRIYGPGGECFELDKARAEVAKLREALEDAKAFVSHWDSCTAQQRELTGCICGLTAFQHRVAALATPAPSNK